MDTETAKQAADMVNRFVARFGPSHRDLARYAALPLVLTPDLVNYLRCRFLLDQVPWVAEADLLLSELCQRTGYEQFVMEPDVRAHLIAEMSEQPGGRESMREISRLLVDYVGYLSRTNPFVSDEDVRQQQWAALACLDEERVVREITQSLEKLRLAGDGGRSDLLALINLTKRLSPQLQKHPELVEGALEVSRALARPRSKMGSPSKKTARDQSGGVAGRPTQPILAFCSYSHKDESLKRELMVHLRVLERQGLIQLFDDSELTAGQEWSSALSEQVMAAQIILLLVSADYLASPYINEVELKRVLERNETGNVRVIPVVLRPCDWQVASFAKLEALPTNGKPITSWENRDEAFQDVAVHLRNIANALLESSRVVVGKRKAPTRKPRPIVQVPARPVTIFIACHHRDRRFVEELEPNLKVLQRAEVLESWFVCETDDGGHEGEMDDADLILPLLSADFLASDYCFGVEMKRALEYQAAGRAMVIPVVLRACDWNGTMFAKFQALPKDGRPVSSWANRDEALHDIAGGIRAAAVRWASQNPAPKNKPGVFRWAVRTGSDDDVSLVGSTPVQTTVEELGQHPRPAGMTELRGVFPKFQSRRAKGVETTIYEVEASVIACKLQMSGNIKLVLQGRSGQTIIANCPNPSPRFVNPSGRWVKEIATVRRKVEEILNPAQAKFRTLQTQMPVLITGVGFFNTVHGQTGVAPNGLELCPVLSIEWQNPIHSS